MLLFCFSCIQYAGLDLPLLHRCTSLFPDISSYMSIRGFSIFPVIQAYNSYVNFDTLFPLSRASCHSIMSLFSVYLHLPSSASMTGTAVQDLVFFCLKHCRSNASLDPLRLSQEYPGDPSHSLHWLATLHHTFFVSHSFQISCVSMEVLGLWDWKLAAEALHLFSKSVVQAQ